MEQLIRTELDDFELTIPIKSPFILNKPPPELPELIAAFVCITLIE